MSMVKLAFRVRFKGCLDIRGATTIRATPTISSGIDAHAFKPGNAFLVRRPGGEILYPERNVFEVDNPRNFNELETVFFTQCV